MTTAVAQEGPEIYTLPTGAADVERLALLDELYAPASEALIDQFGLRADSRVLDIGCGAGHMCGRLAVRFPHGEVTGVDVSPAQIEMARAYGRRNGHKNVVFHAASAYETGFPTATFDLVFCRAVLWSVRHPLVALAEMRRVLKPGGKLLCEDFDSSTLARDEFLQPLVQLDERLSAQLGVDFNIGPKLPRLLQTVGIANPQIKFFQPVFLQGRGKRFVEYSFAAQMVVLIDMGLATREEIEPHLAALRLANDDESLAAPQFRLSQVWGSG